MTTPTISFKLSHINHTASVFFYGSSSLPFSLFITLLTFMDQKKLFMFRIHTIFFFLLLDTAVSVDLQFEACKPWDCGKGPKISYPFWVAGEQQSYCGYPNSSFQLSCIDDEPIINLSGVDYIIREISYSKKSLLVYKRESSNNICSSGIKNITLNSSPFVYGPAHVDVFVFFACKTPFPTGYLQYSVRCNNSNPAHHSLALFSNDTRLNDVVTSRICETSVIIPVDIIGNSSWSTVPSNELIVEGLKDGLNLRWDKVNDCNVCQGSGGRCGFDFVEYKVMCFCPDRPHHKQCQHSRSKKMKNVIIGIIAAGTLAALITMATILIWCWLRKKSNGSIILWKKKSRNGRAVEAFFKDCEFLAPRRFKYKDIKRMTNSFNDIVGQGGFGSVFKGKLPDGHMVAVKVLNETKGDGNDFINEVASISRTSHVNIVTLLGFCINGPKKALVYEFMPNGSLEKFIYGERPLQTRHLGWVELYRVAIGIARGLEYLHRGCNTRIVHFDIKPHNILLDENFIPKIADFGLSKLSNVTQSIVSMTGARGTPGYIAPELVSRGIGEVSHKSDVYSYGMMVLEMVGGRKNIDVRVTNLSEIYFPHWIHKRLDMNEGLGLHGVTSLEDHGIARKMILVGLWCIQINPTSRPPMSKVLEMLEGSLEALQLPPKPYLSSLSNEDKGSHSSVSSL